MNATKSNKNIIFTNYSLKSQLNTVFVLTSYKTLTYTLSAYTGFRRPFFPFNCSLYDIVIRPTIHNQHRRFTYYVLSSLSLIYP